MSLQSKAALLRARLKPWMLPIAMVTGWLFHAQIGWLQPLAPYLIFAMLTVTFCRIRLSEFRVTPLAVGVVAVQVIGGVGAYYALEPLGAPLAQGVMICILCPTATAAPVITAMLGGSIMTLIAISLLSNLALALVAPALFALIGAEADLTFGTAFGAIMSRVGPLVLGPMAVAFLLRYISPKAHKSVAEHQGLSFYLWAVSLVLVVGRAVSFALAEPPGMIPQMIILAGAAGIACGLQFYIGRRLGRRFGDAVAGAQGLGQKNTVLAVWMATQYLNPISSIAPAAYIAWQNTVNALQLYIKSRHESHIEPSATSDVK